MTVTCDACKTVFKLDDSRIPSDGIRVRCSECQHVFLVTPEVPEDFLCEFSEFERFHKQQLGETPIESTEERPAPVAGEAAGLSFEALIQQEGPGAECAGGESPCGGSGPQESFQPEEYPREETTAESTADNPPDRSFEALIRQEQPLARSEKGESPSEESVELEGPPQETVLAEVVDEKPVSPLEEPAGISFEDFVKQEETSVEGEAGPLPDEGPVLLEFDLSEQSPQEVEPAGEGAAEVSDETAALPSEEPTYISFEGLVNREEPAQELEGSELPTEEIISAEPDRPEGLPTEKPRSDEPDLEPPPAPEPLEGIGAESEKKPFEGEEPKLSVEAFLEKELERKPEGEAGEKPSFPVKQKRLEDLMNRRGTGRGYGARRSSFRMVLLLVVLLVVGGIANFLWHNPEVSTGLFAGVGPTLGKSVQKVSDLWEDFIGFRKGDLELSRLQGYEDMIGQHRIYVIKGDVTNKSERTRRYVILRVVILDQVGNRIRESLVFCGNVFTREELEKLSPALITGEETLQPKRPKDMVVEPNEAISFMAIFSDLPREGTSFKVEKLEAPGV